MKNLTTILLILLGVSAFAQPVIEATYLPVHNTEIKQVYDTVAAQLIVPTKGANQTWNYSSRFTNPNDTFALITYDAVTIPQNSFFPGATHASFLRAPFLMADSVYSFFTVDTAGIQNLGFYSIKSTLDTNFNSVPSEWVTNQEVGYMDQIFDTSRTVGILKDYYITSPVVGTYDVKYVSWRYKEMNADGYGTLSTPLGTFNDVLLGSERHTVVDSFFVDLGFGWVFAQTSGSVFDRYHFLRNNTFATTHLMQLNADTNGNVTYGWYTLPVDVGSISGTVYDTTSLPVTNGEMILYREHSNFTKNDILARTTVDGSGNYQFDSIPYGEYRVACRPDLSIYSGAMTTYVGDTTDWINCQTIITTGPVSVSNDINLVYHPVNSGAGQISGSLGQDFSYARGSGDPIPGIDIIIEKTPGGTPHHEATTDLTGNFNFGNLDDGSYTVFVDIPGLNMAGSYNFTIAGGTVVGGLDFKVGFDSIHPVGALTTVEAIAIENSFVNVFPNPFSSNATIALSLDEKSKVSITLFNVLGERIEEVVNTELVQGAHTFNYSNTQIPSGVYILKVRVDEEEQVIRMIKE